MKNFFKHAHTVGEKATRCNMVLRYVFTYFYKDSCFNPQFSLNIIVSVSWRQGKPLLYPPGAMCQHFSRESDLPYPIILPSKQHDQLNERKLKLIYNRTSGFLVCLPESVFIENSDGKICKPAWQEHGELFAPEWMKVSPHGSRPARGQTSERYEWKIIKSCMTLVWYPSRKLRRLSTLVP